MAASQLVFVLLEALACSYAWPDGSVSNIDTAAAQILWLPDHAVLARDLARSVIIKNGRGIYADSSGAVAFAIESDRAEVSDRVVRHFADAGWHQRSTQQLNPLLPTSYEFGWETHGGGVLAPLGTGDEPTRAEPYYEWRGEWENGRGDIVRYMLGGQGRQLRGYADYAPRSVVESGRRKLGY